MREQFAKYLLAELETDEITIEDGELLIDVPPRGKDQIKNVYVSMGDETRTIQETSPIADAVSETFHYWSRRIRVFLAPRLWEAFAKAQISEATVRERCQSVMSELPDYDFFHWKEGKTVLKKSATRTR